MFFASHIAETQGSGPWWEDTLIYFHKLKDRLYKIAKHVSNMMLHVALTPYKISHKNLTLIGRFLMANFGMDQNNIPEQ